MSNHDERDKAGARRFSRGAVRFVCGISEGDDLIREHRVRGERDEEGEDEAGDDCWPEGVLAGWWDSMGDEEWGNVPGSVINATEGGKTADSSSLPALPREKPVKTAAAVPYTTSLIAIGGPGIVHALLLRDEKIIHLFLPEGMLGTGGRMLQGSLSGLPVFPAPGAGCNAIRERGPGCHAGKKSIIFCRLPDFNTSYPGKIAVIGCDG